MLPFRTRKKTTQIILKKPHFGLDVRGNGLEVTGHCPLDVEQTLVLFPLS